MAFLLIKMMFTNLFLIKCHFPVPAQFHDKHFNYKLSIVDPKVIFIIKFSSGSEIYCARVDFSMRGKHIKPVVRKARLQMDSHLSGNPFLPEWLRLHRNVCQSNHY